MKFITVRDLRGKSSLIRRELPKEKEMVLTSNGKPIGILMSSSPERFEESLNLLRRLRAVEAVNRMQLRSIECGKDRIGMEEINDEIAASRKERGIR